MTPIGSKARRSNKYLAFPMADRYSKQRLVADRESSDVPLGKMGMGGTLVWHGVTTI